VADSNATRSRQRAVGTRDRIMSHLAMAGEIRDDAGMASGVLAREVGYPGSSIAFAQLLSGMERAGLIRREIRGKRTYRITAGEGTLGAAGAPGLLRGAKPVRSQGATRGRTAAPDSTALGSTALGSALGSTALGSALGSTGLGPAQDSTGLGPAQDSTGLGPAALGSVSGFDYDELARRLLVAVVGRLTADRGDDAGLERVVADLERELASERTRHGSLSEENARLREQLQDAQQSLALAQDLADRQAAPSPST
jgi:hypothetical protein